MKTKQKWINVYAFKLSCPEGERTLFCESLDEAMTKKLDSAYAMIENDTHVVRCLNEPLKTEFSIINKIKKKNGYYLIGFSKLNMVDGPAKGNMAGKLEPFILKDDEGFANMCSALYDPQTDAFIVETSLTGLSQDKMFELIYDKETDDTGLFVDLKPVVDADVYNKLNCEGRVIKKIDIKINPSIIPEECYKGNKSLSSVVCDAKKQDLDGEVSLVVQAKRSGSLPYKMFKKFCGLFEYVGKSSLNACSGVSRCQVSIKDDDCASVQVLDLIQARVVFREKVDVSSKRMISYELRFSLLEKAYSKWRSIYFLDKEK